MVKWSFPAKSDLRHIWDYVARDSRNYADKVVNDIVEKSETLDEFPEIGRVVPEIGQPNIREMFVHSYRLIYQFSHSKIEILAVTHGRRDLSSGNLAELQKD